MLDPSVAASGVTYIFAWITRWLDVRTDTIPSERHWMAATIWANLAIEIPWRNQ
ncbi:MAG TPA: hypothetical protein VGO40_16995 [Longimicrobium sp.]|nr:hypothetical protein [Longimicrobium sp.]